MAQLVGPKQIYAFLFNIDKIVGIRAIAIVSQVSTYVHCYLGVEKIIYYVSF